MQERLLQFIWQEKYFDSRDLRSQTGESITVLSTGELNPNQGPDFLNARILLNGIRWAGHVEIHTKSSFWHDHRHGPDPFYKNVILHVVWEDDDRQLSDILPTLVLQDRVSSVMLSRYHELMDTAGSAVIPCQAMLDQIPDSLWTEWKQELLTRRLKRKARRLLAMKEQAGNDWEKASWWWLASHFGGTVNAAFFEQVARTVDWKILSRQRQQVISIEALLLGQAGLLPESAADPYVQLLIREYQYLRNKNRLQPVHGKASKLRMRPASFPELRLAQLAMLLQQQPNLFSRILACRQWQEAEDLLNITANDFWHYHYQLDVATAYQPKHLGSDMARTLIINAIVPILYATGLYLEQSHYLQQAENWLTAIPREKNQVTDSWQRSGITIRHAADSQSLTELRKNYCALRKCLDCRICHELLNR